MRERIDFGFDKEDEHKIYGPENRYYPWTDWLRHHIKIQSQRTVEREMSREKEKSPGSSLQPTRAVLATSTIANFTYQATSPHYVDTRIHNFHQNNQHCHPLCLVL